jgi:3-dehydroquinate synthase
MTVRGDTGTSTVLIGERLRNLGKYIPLDRTIIITDSNVRYYYANDFPSDQVIEIGMGEEIKSLDTVKNIYDALLDREADRSAFLVGIGGGIVCDMTGFVASTYLRGVKFGFVPSTLLSQVDASVGGKNGINFGGYKNMVGCFNQPEFVICDTDLLATLPQREILSGFAEVIKHATIGNAELFSYLEDHYEEAMALKSDVIQRLVYDSVCLKSEIVNRDEKEQGERMKLNFGHTLGHAIEMTNAVSHGEAVSVGMAFASALSERKGWISNEDSTRVVNLIRNLGLPTMMPMNWERISKAIKRDKKRRGETIHFVFLLGIGVAAVREIPVEELMSHIHGPHNLTNMRPDKNSESLYEVR